MTGTSTEYIGVKPLPRVLRDRPVVFVLGPQGVGKSTVATRLTRGASLVCDSQGVQRAILERVRHSRWDPELLEFSSLVLDGPVWLQGRPAVVELLRELLQLRSDRGQRTIVCQADTDASVSLLMECLPVGQCAMVALRFPTSRRARLRAAERVCLDNGIPARFARHTANTSDWSYRNVLSRIRGPFFSLD